MISVMGLPSKVTAAINGAENKKHNFALNQISDKIRFLFYKNSYNVYNDIVGYTSLDNFLNSFTILNNDGKEFKYFVDEEAFNNVSSIIDSENNLLGNQVTIKKQDDYIQRFDKVKVNLQTEVEEYLTNDFWNEFNKGEKKCHGR